MTKNNIEKIAVVGGGTAGLISALVLKKRFPHIDLDIIYSKTIGIIGVGEGSTEHFKHFMDFIGITQYDIIKNCGATFKMGIMFEDWVDEPYLHSIQHPFVKRYGQHSYVISNLVSNKTSSKLFSSKIYWDNCVDQFYLTNNSKSFSNQFHFDTHKLNDFLMNLCKSLKINLIEDDILDVKLTDDNEIQELISHKKTYQYDFYIDSTGFKKILISKLGSKWNSYSKYLKMNSAITFQSGDEENYNIWTLSKAMTSGWMFKIPVQGRHGNGYIFDSNYIDIDNAKFEVEQVLGKEIEIGKNFKFDPGHLDRVWINNCCAIGLSGSFVEPLEATSIGTSIQQSFMLMHKLINYNQQVIDNYNNSFSQIMENIRDFIFLHYMNKKNTSLFWQDVQKLEIPESLERNMKIWQNKIPVEEDFNLGTKYLLFYEDNFSLVMHGLRLFNYENIKKEYDSLPNFVRDDAEITVKNLILQDSYVKTVTHKEYIEYLKSIG